MSDSNNGGFGCASYFLLGLVIMTMIVNYYQSNWIRDLQRRIATLEQKSK